MDIKNNKKIIVLIAVAIVLIAVIGISVFTGYQSTVTSSQEAGETESKVIEDRVETTEEDSDEKVTEETADEDTGEEATSEESDNTSTGTDSDSSSTSSTSSGSSESSDSTSASSSSSGGSSSGSSSTGTTTEPENTDITVTIAVDASDHCSNPGVIVGATSMTLPEGSSVYTALINTGVSVSGSSYYISGIDNRFEKDCGGTSGWQYSVNGVTPMTSCGNYILSNGDSIYWYYVLEASY
jgi:hypothetical protein